MKISNITSDIEREFYGLCDVEAENIRIEGPADGESAFKECTAVTVGNSRFALRYPFWHNENLKITDCRFTETCRAPLWYTDDCTIEKCNFCGPKALRECNDVSCTDCTFNSDEFGWNCADLTFKDCSFESSYFLFNSSDINMSNCRLKGKYSFQYTENLTIENCILDTKDAFWHCTDARISDCVIKGEYLGWYSDGLTFERCKIYGTQPFCYCENLKLIDCEMIDADLAFEYSEVNAQIKGSILSVKNPLSGRIVADSYGEIILGNTTKECDCEILTTEEYENRKNDRKSFKLWK